MEYRIRPIEEKDNERVEYIIRSCLIEFGANHEGTAWEDPFLGQFYQVYQAPESAYWVAEDEAGTVVGGVGIGPLPGAPGVCELQKMYCIPEARGKGIAQNLLDEALDFAKDYYDQCYLETISNMVAAIKFYEKNGFRPLDTLIGDTGHVGCDVPYIKDIGEASV